MSSSYTRSQVKTIEQQLLDSVDNPHLLSTVYQEILALLAAWEVQLGAMALAHEDMSETLKSMKEEQIAAFFASNEKFINNIKLLEKEQVWLKESLAKHLKK